MSPKKSVHFETAARVFGRPGRKPYRSVDQDLAILAFTNRSGSNLLAEYMQTSGYFSRAGEFLNPETIVDRCQRRGITNLEDYLADVSSETNKESRIFALKASAEQILVLRCYGALEMFKSAKVIHIYRNDVIAQAVSFSIAFRTKSWTMGRKPVAEPRYEFEDIQARLGAVLRENQEIFRVCSLIGLSKVDVLYELLETQPSDQLSRVLEHFGLDTKGMVVHPPSLKKQRTHLNEEFAQRYRSDVRSFDFN